ncbi:MAG: aspartate kinase [Bacteroidales bacterium]
MQVYKFGGTSVGSAERISNIAELLRDKKDIIVVLSAMAGTTDSLTVIAGLLHEGRKKEAAEKNEQLRKHYHSVAGELFTCKEIREEAMEMINSHFDYTRAFTLKMFTRKQEKAILAQGELLSTALLLLSTREKGIHASLLPALNFMRIDKDNEPDMFYIKENLQRELERKSESGLLITQGYICRDAYGEVSNLKRGGSDYTATIIGAVLNADEVQIWTDINGLHNNDPRYVNDTEVIRELSFDEAAELAYFGAKILHPSSILPAREKNIRVRLKNSLQPGDPGTIITATYKRKGYKAVAAKDGISAVKIKSDRMLMAYGFLRKVFEIFEIYKTPIDMITTSEVAVSLTIDDCSRLDSILKELDELGSVEVEHEQVIICIVGDFIAEESGTTIDIFTALKGIPLRMISYGGSRHNVSFLVDGRHKKKALAALNKKLFKKGSDV